MRHFVQLFAVLVALLANGIMNVASAQTLDTTEQQLVKQIHQQLPTTLALLKKSVNINSGTMNFSGVKAVGQLMIEQYQSLGFQTQWIDGSAFNRAGHVVATHLSANPNAKKILMIGHLDTVFTKNDEFQAYQQLSPTEATGPGLIDMKGGNAIILASLQVLKAQGVLDNLSVQVVMTGDEESSGRPLALSKKAIIDGGKWADIALGFEDGDGDINTAMVARRGYIGWTLKVSGTAAHSSQIFTQDIGYGAVYEAARILNAFREQLSDEENLTFNPAVIAGGTRIDDDKMNAKLSAFGKSNVVAQTLLVRGDLRALSNAQVEHAKEVMTKIVSQHLPHTQAEIHFEQGYPPMAPNDGNSQLLALYSQVSQDLGYNQVIGANPRKAGAADISFAANYVDMALDGLGLLGRGGHTKNEVADMTILSKNIEKTSILLYRLAQLKSLK